MKLKLKRLNPLLLDPGAKVLMGAMQLSSRGTISQFPVRLVMVSEDGVETPVEIENEFYVEPQQSGDV